MRQESTTYRLARALLALVGAVMGLALADWLLRRGTLTGPNNLLYLTLVGLLLGYLAGSPLARAWERLWQRLVGWGRNVPPESVLAAGTGATLALLVTVLVNNVLAPVPGFTWYWSLLIALVLVTSISWFFVANRRLFTLFRGNHAEAARAPVMERPRGEKLIDTSAIIDGRIAEVIEANFLVGTLLVPRFVLLELQQIADSGDPLRRKRGRRGLEVLDRLAAQDKVPSQVISDDPEGLEAVDDKLMALCQERNADLITTDYNLQRVATLQGIRVLNVNALANGLKAAYLPGERLTLEVVRQGRESGQGVAYLEDGTMVVIEDAAGQVGKEAEVVVTSSLQTNMGRMIFARMAANEDDGESERSTLG